ncbi:MAG: methyltransferase domain-containing protein [Eggerthellaceae bacterium]|nr:methyltransferase domain-containing protein [Eggerthellaceae bacterium]
MNIADAKQQIKDTVEAYLERDDAGMFIIPSAHQRPVFLLGAPGIGKTAIMEQVAEELGIGIVSYSMTHHTRQSALGLPRIEHKTFEGMSYDASEYTMSEIVSAIYDYMERTGLKQGILFLDEINCVSETLYPSMLQFLQFKTFGNFKVPDGWIVCCAGNPPEYNRSVHEFDIVTLDRLREISVEPDYAAWRAYALERGVHPSITTFLESKKDCFYLVESKPGGGKRFVTARGWDDLSNVISLYERLGKPVDRALIAQFIRDEDVADKFAIYYALFAKYRADYQVDSILAGAATDEVRARATAAEFDERVALMGIMLDALAQSCKQVLDQEAVALKVRDVLREVKPELLAGETLDVSLGSRIQAREAQLARLVESGAVAASRVRREKLAQEMLHDFASECHLAKVTEGAEAFAIIERAFKEEVARLAPAAEEASSQMSNAFAFVEECFSAREMLVFTAEISTRKATTEFVSHFGNDAYYAHNEGLQVDEAKRGLEARARELEVDGFQPVTSKDAGVDISQAVGLKMGDDMGIKVQEAANVTGKGDQPLDEAFLREYYSGKQFEYGFASICKMMLPAGELKGKQVLDICSRRGRGVYKISSMVGMQGRAIGVDWSPAFVQESIDGIERAWHDSGLPGNNMDFYVAYPEDLMTAGIGTSTMDVVYVNNVMTLFADQQQALNEFSRVLRPGGLLIMETVFADRERNEAIIQEAREIGNSIQAARTQDENFAWIKAAGFGKPAIEDEYDVRPDQGFKSDYDVPMVADDSGVQFKAVSMYIHKRP